MVEKAGETPVLEPLGPAPTKDTDKGATMKLVKAAWSGSLIIKIALIAVAVLFLMFFIMTIAFGSSRSSCVDNLSKEQQKSKELDGQIARLKQDLKSVQDALDKEKAETKRLREDIDRLNKQITDLKADISKKEGEITSLKQEVKKVTEEKEELQRQINHLNQQLRDKDQEIEHWKHEVTVRDHNITTLKAEITNYIWYLVGSGGVHVGQLIHEIWVHVVLGTANTHIANLTNQVTNLHGEVKNLKDMITRLNNEIEGLKQEINHLTDQQRVCQSELAHAKMEAEELKRELTKIRKQLDIIPKLALDQAALNMLLRDTGHTMSTSLMYNGSHDGYHKIDFISRIGTRRPTVVVVRTKSGYVFGASLNITWATSGDFKEDAGAFTFSSSRDHVCTVSKTNEAVRFLESNFMEFGNHEIAIESGDSKNPLGAATSDITYHCGADDHTTFYNDGTQFTVEDLWVYHVELTKKP